MTRIAMSVLVYGAVFRISVWISDFVGIPYAAAVPFMSLYLLVMIFFLRKYDVLKKYKLCFPEEINRCLWITAPLLLIPALNICLSINTVPYIKEIRQIPLILYQGISAFSEELLFHAVLPELLSEHCRFTLFRRTMTVNVLFALLHLVNAFSGASPGYAVVQSFLAVSIGLCFSGITEISQSLIPAAFMHWLINLSALQRDLYMSALPLKEILIWSGISILGIIYGLMLIRYKEVS